MEEVLIIMYEGVFVDTSKLHQGIYKRRLPCIYDIDTTIDFLVKRGESLRDKQGLKFINETYFKNLKECELVKFTLIQSK